MNDSCGAQVSDLFSIKCKNAGYEILKMLIKPPPPHMKKSLYLSDPHRMTPLLTLVLTFRQTSLKSLSKTPRQRTLKWEAFHKICSLVSGHEQTLYTADLKSWVSGWYSNNQDSNNCKKKKKKFLFTYDTVREGLMNSNYFKSLWEIQSISLPYTSWSINWFNLDPPPKLKCNSYIPDVGFTLIV